MAAKGQGFGQPARYMMMPKITVIAPQKLKLRVQPLNSQRKNDITLFIAVPFINYKLHYSMNVIVSQVNNDWYSDECDNEILLYPCLRLNQ
jgi:hypothetical protein